MNLLVRSLFDSIISHHLQKKSISIYVYSSHYPSIHLCTHPWICLYMRVFISRYASIYLASYLAINLSTYVPIYSISVPACMLIYWSIHRHTSLHYYNNIYIYINLYIAIIDMSTSFKQSQSQSHHSLELLPLMCKDSRHKNFVTKSFRRPIKFHQLVFVNATHNLQSIDLKKRINRQHLYYCWWLKSCTSW